LQDIQVRICESVRAAEHRFGSDVHRNDAPPSAGRTNMKLHAVFTAIALAGFTGVATSQSIETMPPITVTHEVTVAGCSPVHNPDSPACRVLREAILHRFPAWQLGVILGPDSSHWAYVQTGAKDRLVREYGLFLEQYERDYAASQVRTDVLVADKQ
jgi:hypothetical protein